MSTRILPFTVLLLLGSASAQVGNPLPVPPEKGSRTTSTPQVYERESAFQKKFKDEAEKRRALEEELANIRAKLGAPAPASSTERTESSAGPAALTPSAMPTKPVERRSAVPRPKPLPRKTVSILNTGPDTQAEVQPAVQAEAQAVPLVFAVSAAAAEQASSRRETAVPLGSYVKARVLTGVEANTLEPYPVLLQLDHAFVGPNRTKIDLSHCFMIAKAKANLSTERVLGETQQLSCVRDDNEVVTRPAKGYLAGEDSTFGLTGQLISNQGRVLLTAVLANLAKGAGEAIAAAQTTTTIATGGVGGVTQATNITGSTAAYVAGRAATEPASLIASWYLEYARQLVPSIAVGSGRDIWIVLLDTVKVPPLSVDGLE